MKVLIACEYSGRVRDAFAKRGHDAMSCDFHPTEAPGNHYQGDVRDVLYGRLWDLIIAHPDCTFHTNSSVRWLHSREPSTPEVLKGPERWAALFEAAKFFKLFLDHPCKRIAVENPIPHGYSAQLIGSQYKQTIQPWQFGHTETKRTCLWLKGLPPLIETNNVKLIMAGMPKKETDKVHYASPGPDRWKDRSRTYQGIADAMAEQWGSLQMEIAA